MKVFENDEVTGLIESTEKIDEAIVSIVSILNKHGNGRIYFGIEDDGRVVGQEVTGDILKYVYNTIVDKIEPKICPNVSNIVLDDKDCILVEFEGSNVPYFADGRAYIRVCDKNRKLSVDEMRKLLNETNETQDWDSQISDKTIYDVNENTLKEYIDRVNKAKRIPFAYTNKEDVLNRLGVLVDGKLRNAGKVLFCDDSGVELQVAIFATDTKTTFLDIDKIKGNVFELIEKGQEYIRKNILWRVNIVDRRYEYPEIPLDSIREAIVNSYVHKLYTDPKGTEISIFKNRVEI